MTWLRNRIRRWLGVDQMIRDALEDLRVWDSGPPLSHNDTYRRDVRASIATALRCGAEQRGQ